MPAGEGSHRAVRCRIGKAEFIEPLRSDRYSHFPDALAAPGVPQEQVLASAGQNRRARLCAVQVRLAGPQRVRPVADRDIGIHKALDLVRPGDVVVVDGGGEESRALVGEIMTTIAEVRGASGFVIDGAVRDAGALARSDFPCFARSAIHRGPYKNGPGEINVPVSIGGLAIAAGDIVVGDEDGIVAFPQSVAGDLLRAVHAQETREEEILRSIRAGTYIGAYAKPSAA